MAASAANGLDRGLYFYKSRYYDPTLGRFIQPDTIVPNPGDPQSLNRYAYVLNNPLRYTDPSGHYEFEEEPTDRYLLPAASGIMPARRSRSLYAYTRPERRALINRRGHHLSSIQSASSLEKFARLTEYAATLYAPDDIDNYMLDLTQQILGWANVQGWSMWDWQRAGCQEVADCAQRGLGVNIFPEWSGWKIAYIDKGVRPVKWNGQHFHFWYSVAVAYFDHPMVAVGGAIAHEMPGIPQQVGPIQVGAMTVGPYSTGRFATVAGGTSIEDFRLSMMGVDLGSALSLRFITPGEVGAWIRENLGE